MSPKWTEAQAAAINIQGCDLLVSAAAGSGKTAALTERIITSLTRKDNPADITRILAVTFTRAAASELRRRISRALSARLAEHPGDSRLIRQLMLLGSAKICTIDAFYSEIVRSNFQRLGLPAGFRIAEPGELTLLRRTLMEELIDSSYATDEGFASLADHFTGNKDDELLSERFIGLYESVRKLPAGIEYLSTGAELLEREARAGFFMTRAGGLLASELAEALGYCRRVLASAEGKFEDDAGMKRAFSAPFAADIAHIDALLTALGARDYEAARRVAADYSPKTLRPMKADEKTPESEIYRAERGKIRDFLKNIHPAYFSRRPDALPRVFIGTAEICRQLYEFLSQYDKMLGDEKHKRAICDFEDVRRHTLKLLVGEAGRPTDIALSYAARFDEILIDEYQDVDAVQDMIFRALASPSRRFMVGDIKQSIYGFRGAEPSLFASYRAAFGPWDPAEGYECGGEGRSVFMSENFRCDESIVSFVNLVCARIFPACGPSVGYLPQDELKFGKETPAGYVSPKVNVTLIYKPERGEEGALAQPDDGEEGSELSPAALAGTDLPSPEIRFICAEVSRLLREGRRADGDPITPGDIAVLCRTKRICGRVTQALDALGVPTSGERARKYYSEPEVSLMISLLTAIDNPQKDIPLAAALRSPIFGFTMEDLIELRGVADKSLSLIDALTLAGGGEDGVIAEKNDASGLSDSPASSDGDELISCAEISEPLAAKCRAALARITAYRTLSRSLSADRLIRHIMGDTSALALAGGEGQGRAKLLALYDTARAFEAGSFKGLYNFIKYLNAAIEAGESPLQGGGETGGDAVSVITIHHSKGLEFPVCFIAGCAQAFNTAKGGGDLFMIAPEVGPAVRLKDPTGLARVGTPIVQAARTLTARREREEEMRLLYVAMTRARERLYISARVSRPLERRLSEARFHSGFDDAYPVLSAKSYLDWLLLALPEYPSPDAPYTLNIISDDEVPIPSAYSAVGEEGEPRRPERDVRGLEAELDRRFAFRYPYVHLTRVPAKLSVSRLYPGVLDEEEDSADTPAWGGPNDMLSHDTSSRQEIKAVGETPDALRPTIVPSFLTGLTGSAGPADPASIGTATHLFLQFCDFGRCAERGIERELEYLVGKRFIPASLAGLVDKRQIARFFESELCRALDRARWSRREQRFNILLPASLFSSDPALAAELEGEELLVQGVIDLFFEDEEGRLILCDYKTDRLSRVEEADHALAIKNLAARHRTQLSYYAAALGRICGRVPDRVLIYSLTLGDAFDVDVDEL